MEMDIVVVLMYDCLEYVNAWREEDSDDLMI